MITRTKTEKIGLEKIASSSEEKYSVFVSKDAIDIKTSSELKGFLGAKAQNVVIERAIAHMASSLISEDKDILEYINLNKLDIIKKIKNFNEKDSDNHSNQLKINLILWQVIVISIHPDTKFNSIEEFINYCLMYTYARKKLLFGEI